MYRHLLVPIDATDLSIETIGQAVQFARTVGARITFFHAMPDHAASLAGEAEIVRATSPDDFVYAFVGRAGELLAKAESAARALGVPCSSTTVVSASPYEAIIAAARECGCDLIFMASHGRRSSVGMMLGSQTLKVLTHTEIPVLVAATKGPASPARAIGVIRDEHRALAAVLHAWMDALEAARRRQALPDPALMGGIVRYLEAFPATLHHPKEDQYLFRALRQRTHAFDAELDELERQHVRDRAMIDELKRLVERSVVATAATAVAAELKAAVERYAAFVWEHLGREEGVILPAAQRHLTEEDWRSIDAAFASNGDPAFGGTADAELRRLFSRIVNTAG